MAKLSESPKLPRKNDDPDISISDATATERRGRCSLHIMRNLFSIAATLAVILGGAGVAAAEPATFEKLGFPIFEKMGFPITLHQVQVVGPAHVQERSPTPTLTLAGMPASPHQVAVLGPRPKMTEQKISMDRK